MKAMDSLNKKYGKNKIRLASQNGNLPTKETAIARIRRISENNTLPEANFRFH